jgi:hypothetical protein
MRSMSPILLLSLAACADYSMAADNDSDGSVEDTADSLPDTDDDDTDAAAPPDFWSVDGELSLVEGVPEAAASTLTLSSWVAGEVSCARVVPVESALSAEAPPESGAIVWWTLAVGDGETPDPPCDFERPSVVEIGFAPPDARLQPAMDEQGLGEAYAYSVLIGGDPVFVFGIAGTEDNLAGRTAVDAAVVPDGTYTIVGLQLLPVP